ncbi:MAG: extracellular solute-binding protein [Lachnospiraceae bacterium]|nr:extracellular solute-binding protein [Lachnospiraceae bacterium]
MHKRVLSILIVFTVLAGLFTGCKGESAKTDPDVVTLTLALRDGIYADAIEACLPEFEKENNLHCEVQRLSEEDLHSKVVEDAVNTGGAYDLCMVDGSWMAEYTAKMLLLNLSEYGYELDEDIIPATTKVCYYGDDVYLAPYYGNVTVLLYNKDILERTGYSPDQLDNLDAIYEICYNSATRGNLGFMYRGDSNNNYVVDFLPILLSCGGWVVDENNNPTVDTPEFKAAVEFYKQLTETGTAIPRDDLVQAIESGNAAMGIGWPGWYTPSEDSPVDYSAVTGKKSADSEAYNASVYGVWTVGIPANSQKPELAVKLLKYLMDPEVQRSTVEKGGVPCRYSSLKDPKVLEKYPQYEAVCEALESGVYRPIMQEWPEFYDILGKQMEKMLHNAISVDAGCNEAQAELEKMLSYQAAIRRE